MTKQRRFLCSYHYRGENHSLDLYADSLEDAGRKMASVSSGKVDGEIVFKTSERPLSKTVIVAMWVIFIALALFYGFVMLQACTS